MLLIYFTLPHYMPEYTPGLLWLSLLTIAGAGLFAAAGSRGRHARLVGSAGALAMVVALGGSIYSGVATRVWIQAVIQLG
jgi:hypothetical protein